MKIVKLHHDKVNLVYSTDWHIAAVPPGRRQDNYQEAILNKLTFVRDLAVKFNGVALCGGDVFHVKNPKSPSNSISLLVELLQLLRTFPTGHPYGAIGNHDISSDRMDTLPNQPLGILIAAGAYYDLNVDPVLFVNADESIKVLVETFPYEHGNETLERLLKTEKRPEGITHRVAVVHAYGEPGNGGSLYGEPKIGYNQIKHLDYDFMLWGHDHSRKETIEVGNITHVNLGSMARAAFDWDEAERPVVATILSFATDGIRYKEKEIQVKALDIAFKTADKKVEDVAKSDELKEFFSAMEEQVDEVETTDPLEVLRMLCPPEEVKLFNKISELCEF